MPLIDFTLDREQITELMKLKALFAETTYTWRASAGESGDELKDHY